VSTVQLTVVQPCTSHANGGKKIGEAQTKENLRLDNVGDDHHETEITQQLVGARETVSQENFLNASTDNVEREPSSPATEGGSNAPKTQSQESPSL